MRPFRYDGYEVELRLVRKRRAKEPYLIRFPRDVYTLFERLQDEPCEHFYEAFLNAQRQITGVYCISKGGYNTSPVDVRAAMSAALVGHASALILVHNHPSGDPAPSVDDRAITNQLVLGGRLLDLPVMDHVIIGHGRYVSFVEAGLMPADPLRSLERG